MLSKSSHRTLYFTMQFIDTTRREYKIYPKYKNSFTEIAHYSKELSTNKTATVLYTTVWRNGHAKILLNDDEKDEIMQKQHICITEYAGEFCDANDGCDTYAELKDADTFTTDEMNEIMCSVCEHVDNDEVCGDINDCNPEFMENDGGWMLDETHYYIDGGCVLKLWGDDDADDDEADDDEADEDDDEEDEDDEEELGEDEFKCNQCSTIQGLNNCELCDAENVCEECHGQGGDYGPNEIWVCNNCLPVCLECDTKLYSACDECCGKGRSDITDDEADEADDEADEAEPEYGDENNA